MAKTKEPSKGKEPIAPPQKPFFKDERVQFTLGLFVIFLSVYVFIAFVSYIFTWKSDHSMIWSNILPGKRSAENWTGPLGAILAAQFMNRWFGLASLLLPAIVFLAGLRMLKLTQMGIARIAFKLLLGVLLFSLTAGFVFGTTGGFLGSGIGGGHGLFVSQLLTSHIGPVGTSLLLLLLAMAYLLYTMPSSLTRIQRLVQQLAERRAQRRAQPAPQPQPTTAATTAPNSSKASAKTPQPTPPAPTPEPTQATEDNSFTVRPASPTTKQSDGGIDFEITPAPAPEPASPDTTSASDNIAAPTPSAPTPLIATQPQIPVIESDTDADLDDDDDTDDIEDGSAEESTDEDVQFTIEAAQNDGNQEVDVDTMELYDPTLELSHYQLPPVELLEDYVNTNTTVTEDILIQNKNRIIETLQNYKIQIDRIKATIGPTVTLYEIVPAPGIRISKIKNLEDDIALSLAALGIRIIAPIPGKGTIGIEVPNEHPEVVSMHSIIRSQKFQECGHNLAIALGKTISNEIFILDLAKLPHLLVAGATGQGKSVGLNAIIASLLYKKHPAELKFVLVDPKKVELSLYSKLERHFLAKLPDAEEPIITDTQKVVSTLNSLCIEMDQRYDLLKQAGAKSIKEYNEKFVNRRLNPLKGHRYLPYIVVIIDEFADLIMTAGREVETPIARLAQLARAIGIHLIIATQRPSANIITGIIKANFPARIAFRVSSSIDSRTILDHTGANNLIGRGDMLVSAGSDMVRVQCAFIDTPEIEHITDFIGNQQGYGGAFELPEYVPEGAGDGPGDVDLRRRDDLFDEAARMVVQTQMGSTSQIQRKFSIGYNRAGRIMDQLEVAGIVGPFEGSKARQVLIVDEHSLEQILSNLANK